MSNPTKKLRYSISASMTGEGRERERKYYEALGRFTHWFAKMESAIALSLWFYARTPHPIAKAVFSGVRVKEASSFMNRIADATSLAADTRTDLREVLLQATALNDVRNQIMHFGAANIAEGRGYVSNALKAVSEDKITSFPISPEILADLTADCRKIIFHLRLKHAGIAGPKSVANRLAADSALRAPWRYTRPSEAKKEAQAQGGRTRQSRPTPPQA